MIKALIFDFDGLMLDTEVPEYRTWEEIFESYGCQLPFSVWAESIGRASSDFDPYEHLEKLLGKPVNREEVRAMRNVRFEVLLNAQKPLPGVEDYIREATRLGLKLAVASSSSPGWVAGHLERLELARYFACIRCAGDVTNAKPDPELYLSAMEKLKVTAPEAIAFEDSPNGITAARQAGIFCVAVPNELTSKLSLEHASMRLNSLAELPLAELIEIVENHQAGRD